MSKMKIIVDKGKKKVKLYITRSDLHSPVLQGLFDWYKPKPTLDDIDVELHQLISDMWNSDYRTFNCCSGHGKHAGFIIFFQTGKRGLRGVSWGPDEPVPKTISQLKQALPVNGIELDSNENDGGVEKWLEIKTLVESKYSSKKA